jgi:hypothetical protein
MIQELLVKLSNTLKVDISGLDINQQSSSDDDDTLVGQIDEEVQSNQKRRSGWNEKTEGWDYENSSQGTAHNVQGRSPEQQFWSANKAAFNEAYQFEDGESAIGRKARGSSRGSASIRGSIDHGQSDYRERGSGDLGQTNRSKFGSIEVGQIGRDEEFSGEDPRDSGLIPYRQTRDVTDGYISRADRRQFRTEVYQKRLRGEGKQSSPETRMRRESNSSREIPSDAMSVQRVDSRQRSSGKISPRREVRRAESMPPRLFKNNSPPRRPKESYYTGAGPRRNSPKNFNTESFRSDVAERRRDRKEIIRGTKRSPERFVISCLSSMYIFRPYKYWTGFGDVPDIFVCVLMLCIQVNIMFLMLL